jgi:hypothetical protein
MDNICVLLGYIVLCASLELANRSIISGSVRLVYSILYSLFLGFGLSMGAEVYSRITGLGIVGSTQVSAFVDFFDSTSDIGYHSTLAPIFDLMLRGGEQRFPLGFVSLRLPISMQPPLTR